MAGYRQVSGEEAELLRSVPEPTFKQIQVMRALALLYTDHNSDTSPSSMAKKLRLEERSVRTLLNSSEFLRVLEETAAPQLMKPLMKAFAKLDAAIDEMTPLQHHSALCKIVDTLVRARSALAKSEHGASEKEADAQLNNFLNSLKVADARIESVRERSDENPPPDPEGGGGQPVAGEA